MNKSELIDQIAKRASLSRATAASAVDAMVTTVRASLKKGNSVTLVGFGTFSTSVRKARTGRNPQTGAAVKIPKRKVVRFKPGKGLKESVN